MLTIEDGTIVAAADSFATAAELADYAAAYGLTVPATAAEQEVLLRRAAVAMGALRWKGDRLNPAMPWPRYGVEAHGFAVASNSIPDAIKHGQMALAAEIHADDLAPPEQAVGAVVEKTVDVLSVKYAAPRVMSRAAPKRASTVHFAPYLVGNGAIAVIRA